MKNQIEELSGIELLVEAVLYLKRIDKNTSPETKPLKEKKWLTTGELSLLTGKSVKTIYNWRIKGILPFVKKGHSVLFDADVVREVMKVHFNINVDLKLK